MTSSRLIDPVAFHVPPGPTLHHLLHELTQPEHVDPMRVFVGRRSTTDQDYAVLLDDANLTHAERPVEDHLVALVLCVKMEGYVDEWAIPINILNIKRTSDEKRALVRGNKQRVLAPGVPDDVPAVHKVCIEAMRLPRGSFEYRTGHGGSQARRCISTNNGLQLQRLTDADKLHLARVLFEFGRFRGIVEHLRERTSV